MTRDEIKNRVEEIELEKKNMQWRSNSRLLALQKEEDELFKRAEYVLPKLF